MSIISDFFAAILKGESKTYNDHNWYVTGSALKGYIEGVHSSQYPLLKKPLSQYTVGEIMTFQARPRDSSGQLWAVGRYQIIPSTLKGLVKNMGLSNSTLFDAKTQDAMGLALLTERSAIRKYIKGELPDTTENLARAALEVAKVWSSVGVPYPMQGNKKFVQKNESYYSGGGDKASVSTEVAQSKLKYLRDNWKSVLDISLDVSGLKKKPLLTVLITAVAAISIYVLIKTLNTK